MAGKGKRVLVGVRLPVTLAKRLKVKAAQHDTSIQALMEDAVLAGLAKAIEDLEQDGPKPEREGVTAMRKADKEGHRG